MAYIEKRISRDGTISYRAQIRAKGQKQISETFPTKRLAEAWAKKTETEIKEGRFFKSSQARKRTVAEMIEKYIEEILPSKPKSIKKQTSQLNWWKQEIGHKFIADISPSLLRELMVKMAKTGKGPATINRYRAALSHCFSTAMKQWEWLESTPFSRIEKLKEPQGRERILSPEERCRFLEAAYDLSMEYPQMLLFAALGLSVGSRAGELTKLEWQNVNLEEGTMMFRDTKNKETRPAPINNTPFQIRGKTYTILSLFKDHAANRTSITPLVFPAKRNPNKPFIYRTAWDKLIKKAQIKDFVFHNLRHCAASELIMSGASDRETAEILGHKSLSMVKRYSHLRTSHMKKVVERMAEKIFGEIERADEKAE